MKLESLKLIQSFLETCILHSWGEIHHWLQSGTRHVLLNSLKDVLEKPRRRGTPKEARDFKIDTELSGDLHAYFILTWNAPYWLGTKHFLIDYLEDALETPRRWDTFKKARDFKIDTELPGDLYAAFLTWNAALTPVRNHACPLRLLGGRSGDT